MVAQVAGELLLCEAAPGIREALAQRFAGNAKIRVLAPHEVARLPDHSLDLVVLHSVLQYLTPIGASVLFTLFHRLLKRSGVLVVSDVIPPEVPATTDSVALLRFGSANGFLLEAAWGLVRTMFSHYSRLRVQLGLTRYAKTAIIEKLSAAGFEVQLGPLNIGHNQARRAYYGRPR